MTNCRIWQGSINADGYARFYFGGRIEYAHRIAWQNVHGPIPKDKEVNHICRQRACVRVDHLELLTHKENIDGRKVDMVSCLFGGFESRPLYLVEGDRVGTGGDGEPVVEVTSARKLSSRYRVSRI